MTTTVKQDKEFVLAVIDKRLLESSIKWIADNMIPEDVFNYAQLSEWAIENGYEEVTD